MFSWGKKIEAKPEKRQKLKEVHKDLKKKMLMFVTAVQRKTQEQNQYKNAYSNKNI